MSMSLNNPTRFDEDDMGHHSELSNEKEMKAKSIPKVEPLLSVLSDSVVPMDGPTEAGSPLPIPAKRLPFFATLAISPKTGN